MLRPSSSKCHVGVLSLSFPVVSLWCAVLLCCYPSVSRTLLYYFPLLSIDVLVVYPYLVYPTCTFLSCPLPAS